MQFSIENEQKGQHNWSFRKAKNKINRSTEWDRPGQVKGKPGYPLEPNRHTNFECNLSVPHYSTSECTSRHGKEADEGL